MKKGKLELTWVGKNERIRLEPRVLVEDVAKSYGDPKTENMVIFGDNLLALKALEQDFSGRIKCIAIDPPYNTGSAFDHYDDGIEHSIWLSLMRNRLQQLHRLLAEDGSIWICIDDNEGHYLKVLCDEIFGRRNFITTVLWQKIHSLKNDAKIISVNHDLILLYAKDIEKIDLNLLPRTEMMNARFVNPDNDPRGPWSSGDLVANEHRKDGNYIVKGASGKEFTVPEHKHWVYSKENMEALIADNGVWFGANGTAFPRKKRFLSDVQQGRKADTWWVSDEVGHNQEAKREIQQFNQDEIFTTPKPERLIQRILTLATKEGDLVLDSFAGSGTTGAVAHKMGRKWIMCELGEHCHTHILPRMKTVIDGEHGGISKAENWKGGGGFKYYRLAESLLVRDKDLSTKDHPVYIINPRYDAKMLIRAVCKIENFRYRNDGRLHGISSESRFLHVTTQLLTQKYLDSLAEDIAPEQSLLVYCTRSVRGLNLLANVEIKKIPRDLLSKCDFQEEK